jgi:hypothetical protein
MIHNMHCTWVPLPIKLQNFYLPAGRCYFQLNYFKYLLYLVAEKVQEQRRSLARNVSELQDKKQGQLTSQSYLFLSCIVLDIFIFSISSFLLFRSTKRFSIPDRWTGFLWTIHALTTRTFSIKVRLHSFRSE